MFIYKNRIFDALLKDALESKGAVVVRGPKWCGKTTTAEQVRLADNAPDVVV